MDFREDILLSLLLMNHFGALGKKPQIREFFGFRELTAKDNELLIKWLNEQVQFTHDTDYLKSQAYNLFRKWKVEPPSVGNLK